jgi:hypothetical protein
MLRWYRLLFMTVLAFWHRSNPTVRQPSSLRSRAAFCTFQAYYAFGAYGDENATPDMKVRLG